MDLSELLQEKRKLQGEAADTRVQIAVQKGYVKWLESSPLVLQRNEHSRAHKLFEAMRERHAQRPGQGAVIASPQFAEAAQVFVVKHDWAAVLGDTIEQAAGGVSLPYDSCVFEFMINGRCVIVIATQQPGEKPVAQPFLECDGQWFAGGEQDCAAGSPFHFAWLQIVAVCIALDAEVATHEVIRAPEALNKKRERSGRPPLKDFHVVDLAKRHRVQPFGAGSTHRSPRLHFRRGHWRHFETHKTWIKWMLVGNPDLGFVQKQYRL